MLTIKQAVREAKQASRVDRDAAAPGGTEAIAQEYRK